MTRILRCMLAAAAILLLAVPASAQTTTGSIVGFVTAQEDGSALPGVQVEAVHEPTGTRYNTVTRADGRFRLPNVRIGGPYNVEARLDGFHPQEATDVFVSLGEAAELRFQLQLSSVSETITVVGESTGLINPSRTGAESNVSVELIESLPTVDRSFNAFARTNPFFTIGSENEDPDAISVAGRSSRYNNITIDGSVNNDLFGLADTGTPGGQSGTTPISLDAIQELQLVVAAFDVRNGGFSGGGVNAVTRSGSNQFAGSVFYYTRDQSFFGDGPDSLGEFGDFEEDQYGFRLGGPLVEDKVFFFVNADIEDRVTPSGWSIDGASGQQFGAGVGGLEDEANRFRNILINNYGFDPGPLSEQLRDDPSDKYFLRFDFNLSDAHNLTARHNIVDAARDINRPGSFTYEWPTETYDFQTKTNSTVLQLNSAFGPNVFNEARLAFQSIEDRRAGADGVRFPWIEVEDVQGFEFEAGTEPFSTANSLDQDILEIHNDLTWLKGNHTFTFGTHNELFSFSNLFIQNAFGSYQFSDLDQLESGVARNFDYTVIPPGQSRTQDFDVNQLGFYFGDQWAVKSNFTLSYGLRVDAPFFPDSPDRNPVTEQRFGFRTDDIPDGEQLWQPRLGFNWDIEGNGESQLRGGAGIFAGRTPYVWISNQYARTGISQLFIDCNNQPFNPNPDTQDPSCGLDNPGGGEFNFISPDFQYPQVARYNLAYDRQLPWWNLVASAEVVYTDSIEEIDYKNVALTQIGTTFDGRPLYDDGGDAFLITNTSEGEATNFAVKLERPYSGGVWGYVSYAYNDSEVVNEGSSSRAVSNYRFNEAFDPNNAGVSTSDFEVEHRFNASLSYRFNRDTRFPTTVSLFYNHQSGRPFSWIQGSDFVNFGFGGSYNGDGTDGNDLAWVPANEGDVVITNGTWEELDAFISANPVLDAARGGSVERNSDLAPWSHTLDLHLEQALPIGPGNLALTFDLINLGNLLDSDSGQVRYVNFNAKEVWEIEGFTDDGTPIISLANITRGRDDLFEIHNINSRWRAKVGVRYTF
ncbi:MAG: carboxypeptidase regulatory-like domain-containing protein [Acidobacteriota bacterium]|nr:carboxypeptidase regulatory-like domain-containing protein [Acidobacteriota bacterium]